MMKLSDVKIEKLFTYQNAHSVKSICQTFFEMSELNYFCYFKLYKNGNIAGLVSDSEWFKYFLKNNYRYQNGKPLSASIHLWQNIWPNQILNVAKEFFNHEHGIYVVKPFDHYVESCCFATRSGNSDILTFYLNKQYLLEQFILYFREQAHQLIKAAENNVLPIGPKFTSIINNDEKEKALTKKWVLNLIKQECMADCVERSRNLSELDIQCLCYLAQGKSAKEIGHLLQFSHRTIEHHFEKLRYLLNLFGRNKLMEFARSRQLDKML